MTSDNKRQPEGELPTTRKTTDFTIEHILNRAGGSGSTLTTNPSRPRVDTSFFNYFQQVPRVPEVESYAAIQNVHSYANDKCYQEAQELNDSFDTQNNGLPFTWLQCTRYCPPKVPRKKDGPQKRQLGRHPRIPFTSHQLSVLEDKFKHSPYLSSEEVTKISRVLDLADIRVKIWFQNRRARERREKIALSPLQNSPPASPPKD